MILIIKALLSYPLPYFASVELLESSLFVNTKKETIENIERQTNDSSNQSKPLFITKCYNTEGDIKFWAICLRVALILLTLFLAIFIPHFAILMGLIGSITGTLLSLIWPCYFHLKLKSKTLTLYQKLVNIFIILFGILISIIGFYYSGVALLKALKNEEISLQSTYYKKNGMLNIKNGDLNLNGTII